MKTSSETWRAARHAGAQTAKLQSARGRHRRFSNRISELAEVLPRAQRPDRAERDIAIRACRFDHAQRQRVGLCNCSTLSVFSAQSQNRSGFVTHAISRVNLICVRARTATGFALRFPTNDRQRDEEAKPLQVWLQTGPVLTSWPPERPFAWPSDAFGQQQCVRGLQRSAPAFSGADCRS